MKWKNKNFIYLAIFLFLIPFFSSTEYIEGQNAKLWIQLLNNSNQAINTGVCFIDIYTPDNEEYLERATMTNFNHDGLYYYDFVTPKELGTYPVLSLCYYQAGQTFHNPTSYFIEKGSYDSGLINDTVSVDTNFIRFKETTINPVRNISVGVNFSRGSICSNISESLLTGITIRTVARFDSVVNDDITIYIYNYTSNNWLQLPNKILQGASWKDVTNSFQFNNISKAGLVNSTGNGLKIKFNDTGLTDGATSNLDLDLVSVSCDQLFNASWIEVRGSSEFHVSSNGNYEFEIETLCGSSIDKEDNPYCSVFQNNLSYWNYTWGFIRENITFFNDHQINISSNYLYETSDGQDCTALIEVIEERNGLLYDITNNITFSGGLKENCIIDIPVDFINTETNFSVYIFQDNYLKWENQRIRDYMNYYENYLNSLCNSIAYDYNLSYVIPINMDIFSLYYNKPDFLLCYRIKDDLYFFDYYFNISESVETSGDYESYLFESRFYYEDLKDQMEILSSSQLLLFMNQTFTLESLDVEILPMTFSYSLFADPLFNITMSVPTYPYVDLNTTYPITLIPSDNNVYNISIYLTELDGNVSIFNFTWNNQTYNLDLIFTEVGNYPFVINSSNWATTGDLHGIFLVREPFNINMCGYYDKTAKKYKNEFADLTAELTNERFFKYNDNTEPFLSPLYPYSNVQTPVFHANYRNGCANLKLYEKNEEYAIRLIDGVIIYPFTYSPPNISKSYGTNVYIGRFTFNGTNQNMNVYLSDKDLFPYKWLLNLTFFILIFSTIIISIILFFALPQYPMFSIMLGIGGTITLSILRGLIWLWKY